MPSSRRALLTSVGAALTGLAGCLDGSDDGPTDSTATTTPTPTSTATPDSTPTDTPAGERLTLGESLSLDGVTLTVSDLVTAHSARYLTAPDAMGVATTRSNQFVFVDVSARGEGLPPAPHRFALVADGDYYGSGIAFIGPARVDAPVTGRRYTDSNPDGHVGFRVPSPLDAESVAVILGGGPEVTDMQPDDGTVRARWQIPESALAPLRSPPPTFETTITVPDSVAADETITVRLDVTNTGDGDGTFYGALNHQGPLYAADPFTFSLPAGESTTHEIPVGYYRGSDLPPERVQFSVVGYALSESFDVRIEGGGTPDGTTTDVPG
ncbi:hypothetical protein [Haloplanus aerogenes]|uniref:Uncharacterized protein n=1 Tax=Haloplanus aerogenes TaxID=660522 RepID=A0A3M0DUR4_9EURY|nr:hypothetical protein [Haloplanus aerogenes]AZH24672.1 hypothetical protein DU502_04410 [Haloplanus aerogenes]RMB23669.1 hypothetical protein ATH50_0893 [Haloplanus aerogenes]